MKAVAVFPERKDVHVIDHPEPKIAAPDEVLLRMLEVGVCGTDKEICQFEYGTSPRGSDYFVLGHESLAEVVDAGPGVDRVRKGDLVVAMVRRPCPHEWCHACRAGRQDFCFSGDYDERGIKDMHGFMTELVVDHQQYLNIVPRELRDVAVLVEPLTIAEKAFIQVGTIQKRLPWSGYRHKAVVLGAGPVGLLGAMALVVRGFDVFVYSRSPKPNPKAAVADAVGAAYISSEVEALDDFVRRVGNIDLVYEATGASQLAFEVLKCLGANGVFVLTGVPSHGNPVKVDTDTIMRNLVLKNQLVVGTVNAGPDAFASAIRDLAEFAKRWPAAVRSLVTGRYPIEEFRKPVFGEAGGIKNVIALAE